MLMFDPKKPVKTRDGRPARIVSEKAGGMFPIIAVVEYGDGSERTVHYTVSGSAMSFPGAHPDDLINVSEETLEYRNVYPTGFDGETFAEISTTGYVSAVSAVKARKSATEVEDSYTLRIVKRDGKVVAVELVDA